MSNYELVCGLETHIELSTKTKIFCSCTTEFGGDPNTHCCPVCIGLPGTLPKLNKKVVEYAVMAGLATNCEISPVSKMDRKNYVYPDLPKAYQISQYDMPLCKNGYVELSNGRKVRILRIHIEEDAGKLVHQRGSTYVDYNRGGVPLIEIVTEPDIRSIDEAREYLERLQLVMRFLGISDCKMQEGSMRCDVNVSVRPQGTEAFGTRTEIKNMNSFTHMAKAMEYEVNRQIDLLQSGEKVVQETRRYNEEDDCTESMRGKEDAHDYRYFREPDLVTIQVSEETVAQLREKLPELPHQRLERYRAEFGIPEADAQQLIKYRRIADYFEAAIDGVQNPKVVANCMIGQIFSRLDGDSAKESFQVNVTPENLNALVKLLDEGKIKMNLLKATLEKMLDTGKAPGELISEADMGGVDADALKSVCEQAIASNPNAVSDYLSGKEKALKAILGSVMKATRGRADAMEAEKLLIQLIQGANAK
ncbi:Asp-tRNA(Asn)/Glu-tRNA(Gln) amidotransferase subunit GatB [Caproiciproducens sp. CPB-2]|uniref:Asp-tRNA(Asn)/Glu-tRNA(Gln) amidotransferase subunit GatB n=1 Tax=Caproiciproducens sp. CPB-2 TaxID=3030017 RepID=UPI0023DB77DD|nr:Asp-tRNA(Asn)/Glu-tRNA(Gln) amidotransferase subunit GatB [Caproiciproducens sp. CPB-2]MDF1493919.1 Asp-tRNA(Asn)/Glu-tRNA(Gln) amidotransferase subunit GatB [Caproiciproducens sp. CPB-2]